MLCVLFAAPHVLGRQVLKWSAGCERMLLSTLPFMCHLSDTESFLKPESQQQIGLPVTTVDLPNSRCLWGLPARARSVLHVFVLM